MIIVIIAGGSGTRLWPLSTANNPKQLLTLTNDRSMVQNTYDRAKRLANEIYVVPDISHADALKAQLPELDEDHFVVEPGRRGTANCIVAALAHVAKRHDHNEPIAFIHADHHIRDVEGFVRSFEVAGKVSTERGEIALIGIEPTYPATGFGYIQRGSAIAEGSEVCHRNKAELIGNYGEYSGGPTREETQIYADTVLAQALQSTAPRKAIVLAGGVANFTDVKKTFAGVIDALTKHIDALKAAGIKVYVRRGGPKEKEGLALMKDFLIKHDIYGSIHGSDIVLTTVVDEALEYVDA